MYVYLYVCLCVYVCMYLLIQKSLPFWEAEHIMFTSNTTNTKTTKVFIVLNETSAHKPSGNEMFCQKVVQDNEIK